MSDVRKQSPFWKEMESIVCPECSNTPADSRVISKTDLGAGIMEQRIYCDECGEIYSVTLL